MELTPREKDKLLIFTAALLALPWTAIAHEGHGESGVHWHATDAWGFIIVAVAGLAGAWLSRKK